MATAMDVAAHILDECGPMPATKLQKLVYYSQAWHLVWDDSPLFKERIEAWANGPVVPALYQEHRQQYVVDQIPAGDPGRLTPIERNTISAVLKFYGDKTAYFLSELTHREDPWLLARNGLPPGTRSNVAIDHASIAEYYGSLV